jgi:membrane protein required for colicin V production
MNWLDYVLVAILVLSMMRSFGRGFTREIIGLVSAFAAIVLGMWFYGPAGTLVKGYISSDRADHFIGFLIVVFAVLVTGAIVGSIVRRFVKAVGLSFFDRLLGAGFGLIRGALIAIALLTAYIAFGPQGESKAVPSAVVHSQIAPYLMQVSSVFVDAAPMELKRNFREVYADVQAQLIDMARSDSEGAANKDPGKK